MQNKPNFDKGQNKPNPLYKKDLRRFYTPSDNEKQTQYEPNQSQSNPKQTQNKAKTNPKQTQSNPIRVQDFAVRPCEILFFARIYLPNPGFIFSTRMLHFDILLWRMRSYDFAEC